MIQLALKLSSHPQAVIAACVWALLGANAIAERRSVPFTGRIQDNGAVMRCGPGVRYYETGRLTAGSEVSVHRRAPGGWLAIRPPHGSFSWVRNDDLRIKPGSEIAELVRDGSVAWIGAGGGGASNRWQVRLHIGERVKVLGAAERISLNGGPPLWWRRVAPPSGEFRWIQAGDLVEPPGRIVVKDETPVDAQLATKKDKSKTQLAENENKDDESAEPETLKLESPAKSLVDAGEDNAAGENNAAVNGAGKNDAVARMEQAANRLEQAFERFDEFVKPAQHAQWRSRGAAKEIAGPESNPQPREVRFRDRNRKDESVEELPEPGAGDDDLLDLDEPLDGDSFQKAISLLDAEFSLMVSRPMSSWHLDRLKAKALQLAKHGPTALHRGRAALLLDSIQGFDELYVRHLAIREKSSKRIEAELAEKVAKRKRERLVSTTEEPNEIDDDTTARRIEELEEANANAEGDGEEGASEVDYRTPTGSGLRRPAILGSPSRDRTSRDGGRRGYRYDAEGVLKRVTSQRRIAPPYALVDEEGEIVALVKPSPGLNLQTYVGRRVGLYGTQRTLPSFRKTLLTAERVVRTDRR